MYKKLANYKVKIESITDPLKIDKLLGRKPGTTSKMWEEIMNKIKAPQKP